MKKQADANHVVIVKKIDEKVNGLIKKTFERQPTKKRPNAIYTFFVVKDLAKKDDEQQKDFLQGLGLLIMKNKLPLQIVKNVWFKHLVLCLCP